MNSASKRRANAGALSAAFNASLEELPVLLRLVEKACSRAAAQPEDAYAIRLAVEAAFSNIVRHGYPPDRPGPVRVAFIIERQRIQITIEDEAPAFDFREAPAPDLGADLEARAVGGLGLHLIGQFMDEVRHEVLEAGGNRLVLVRRLGNTSRREK